MKSLISVIALATTLNAQAQSTCARQSSVPTPVNIKTVSWQKVEPQFEDYYARCYNFLSELESAKAEANENIRPYQGLTAAANYMFAALNEKASQVPQYGEDPSLPHTMNAIVAASKVANSLSQSLSSQTTLNAQAKGQIKFMIAHQLYNIISKAYYNLDAEHYANTYRSCFGGGCDHGSISVDNGFIDQFREYANGVRDLAVEFINLQKTTDQMQATDKTELAMTAAVAGAAKGILMGSLFGRDYSCGIMELNAIQHQANSYLCNSPNYPTYRVVNSLRARLNNVNFPRRGCHGNR